MRIVFRVDASTHIGSGHIRRCTILAEYLRARGARISFICRTLDGHLCDYLEQKRFTVHRLSAEGKNNGTLSSHIQIVENDIVESRSILSRFGAFDWVIIDHYQLAQDWQRAISEHVQNILVIDDLAIKQHYCKILVNHAFLPQLHEQYCNLVPPSTRLLLGPDYFILDPNYVSVKKVNGGSVATHNRLMVFFGGADSTDETTKAINAIREIRANLFNVDIVVTRQNKNRHYIKNVVSNIENCTLHEDLPHLGFLMAKATLALGAGGGTSYERLFMGLASLVVTTADHQVQPIREMNKLNLVSWLGNSESVTQTTIKRSLEAWLSADSMKFLISNAKMMQIVDGNGLYRIEQSLETD
ncbi:UDP-2,4-diacetamido-2,4,6-trideoxy-beta-L-altropyranose hydrolase [Gammaproteobacteria bacterium]|nr:UDP-2,4-diacetamido-2,4,6-trideoxy-beta-L-altropyranose hydrolase [Gammaproteobacteria bacterium]